MTPGVAAVLRCGAELGGVVESLRDLTDARGVTERVIVAEPITPDKADPWLRGLASHVDARFVRTGAGAGASLNEALGQSAAPLLLCLHAGDRLHPSFVRDAAGRFTRRPELELVTSGVQPADLDGSAGSPAASPTPRALVLDFDAVHPSAMFRRTTWERTGRFADDVQLVFTDFWLRLLQIDGAETAFLPDAPLTRRARSGAWRRELEARRLGEAVEALVARHLPCFTRYASEALEARERTLWELGPRYRQALARREAAQRDLDQLATSIVEVQQSLPTTPLALGDLRRTSPVSRYWGYERGAPLDRYYIEQFLAVHSHDIRGVVLEIQEPDYTQRFGGSRVERSEVLDVNAGNERATIVADLRQAAGVADSQFDCVILTQTLHVIDDMAAVITECERLLRPGGVLLATLPSVSRVCLEYGRRGDFWRATEAGARALFEPAFGGHVEVSGRGNVLASTAFTYGLAGHELLGDELDRYDPYNPTLICVRAVKRGEAASTVLHAGDRNTAGAILVYHRVGRRAPDPHGLSVPADVFRDQMQELARRFRPVALHDLAEMARMGRIDPGSVAVTFDDGYADALEIASPILTGLGIPATFFLTTDRLDQPFEYWWDRLARALLDSQTLPSALTLDLPGLLLRLQTTTAEERLAAHRAVYHAVVGLPADERDAAVDAVCRWGGLHGVDRSNRRLTRDEIRQLADRPGQTIGAHGIRHVALPSRDPNEVRSELVGSRRALETLVGRPVDAFAYPYGAFDDSTRTAASEAGYRVAVTCEMELVGPGAELLALPRLEVPRQSNGVELTLARLAHDAAARRP